MIEVWKDIDGYEGLYQVSNLGRIRSLKYGKERILKHRKDKDGYLRVGLYKNSKMKDYFVHRLVALVFIPNPNNLPCINHKDENKTNNSVDNIEWCTQQHNANYGTRNFKTSTKLSIPIIQLTLNNEFVTCYRSSWDAERITGFNQGNINSCCNGKRKTSNGYKWLYAKDYKGRYEVPLF